MQKNRQNPVSLRIKTTDKEKLGDWAPQASSFPDIEKVVQELSSSTVLNESEIIRFEKVNERLFGLIKEAKTPCFLLPATLDYIDRINQAGVLDRYTLTSFELYLNHLSNISHQENYSIRSKIVGKSIPREQYQHIFPVGMGKMFPGTHFVTAHSSPDLDTTVASFWGWMDAFGCRVGNGLHIWNVPGGAPEGQEEISFLFKQIFGDRMFSYTAKTRSALSVTGLDLMTQKGMLKKTIGESSENIDHERNQNAVILVDKQGYYLGDWRHFDVEGVRQVILLVCNCLRWFESHLHVKLLGLFAKEKFVVADVEPFLKEILEMRIADSYPAKDFSEKQKGHVHEFLVKVLKVSKGIESTFEDFAKAMKHLALTEFQTFMEMLESLGTSSLFDSLGNLSENRPKIFHYLEKMIEALDLAIRKVRGYVDRLDVALHIKTEVFGYLPQYVSSRADIEEIRNKIGGYPYLTVTVADLAGNLFPVGIIPASDAYKSILGTVTLRDFCNRDETKIPSYLEVISVVDHHKVSLQTSAPPVATISDAQSSNGMVAELAFAINDAFGCAGMDEKEIAQQIQDKIVDLSSPVTKRVLQRLLQKQLAFEKGSDWFIAPEREFVEYLHFLYAILDDTDLLTKVSPRDLHCVASLLNRLKTLSLGREVETVNFDDFSGHKDFANKAARRLLQNDDLYSLYRKVYHAKEEAVARNIVLCAEGKPSVFFADTKEQNGCCRVGQTKMFVKNISVFEKHVRTIRKVWLEEAKLVQKEKPEVDLHIQMSSTLAGADDLYKGITDNFPHRDEMWIWIPSKDEAIGHLKSFLNAFKSLPVLHLPETEVEFLGSNAQELSQIFAESFLDIPTKITASGQKEDLPIAVLRFKAGTINSRKAQVSPFLPKPIG